MSLPPEWKKRRGTLLVWPQRPSLWGGAYAEVQRLWAQIAALLSRKEEAHILLPSHKESLREEIICEVLKKGGKEKHIFFHDIETDDVWIRDYAPLWVEEKKALLFLFDGWGQKYSPHQKDNLAGAKLLKMWGHQALRKNFVLEGGAIDSDGETLLLSESSILFRSPFWERGHYEEELKNCFGVKKLLWLKGGLPGDDTDGHVDMLCRFTEKNKVLNSMCEKGEPAFGILRENQKRLETFRDLEGRPLEIVQLPLPPQIYKEGRALARSYANFYIAEGQVLAPVYGEKTDELALKLIQKAFPQRNIEAIDASLLILEGGALHCLTMQIPDLS